MLRITSLLLLLCIILNYTSEAQDRRQSYGYGTVIGGERTQYNAQSYLDRHDVGMRITLIKSRGSGGRQSGAGGIGGGIQIFEVPRDTDFLELFVFYARLDPRQMRQGKIRILRLEQTGEPPYYSKDIHRTWTEYSFRQEYRNGGPFTVLEPGDIIIIEGRGIFNRKVFDPLADINFILGLPTVALSVISLYQLFR